MVTGTTQAVSISHTRCRDGSAQCVGPAHDGCDRHALGDHDCCALREGDEVGTAVSLALEVEGGAHATRRQLGGDIARALAG